MCLSISHGLLKVLKLNSDKMTKEQLIDIACRWLDHHQSKNIVYRSDGTAYVAGCCQTDLRFFLNSVKDMDYYDALDMCKT